MAEIREKRVIPAREEDHLVAVTCDLCGARSRAGGDWDSDPYRKLETNVSMQDGTSYPENTNYVETKVDICPECFVSKLLPWVEAQGGKPRKEDVSF